MSAKAPGAPELSPANALLVVVDAFERLGLSPILEGLRKCGTPIYLVGGAIRDMILGASPSDIDLMVPNGSVQVDQFLAQFCRHKVNRHGNREYRTLAGRKIDVIEPRYFYKNFATARDAVEFFDSSANAMGIEISTGAFLDPLGGYHHLKNGRTYLPRERWQTMSEFESVHLVLRLCKLLEKHGLSLVNPSLATDLFPLIWRVDWADLARLHGLSRSEAVGRVRRFFFEYFEGDDPCGTRYKSHNSVVPAGAFSRWPNSRT